MCAASVNYNCKLQSNGASTYRSTIIVFKAFRTVYGIAAESIQREWTSALYPVCYAPKNLTKEQQQTDHAPTVATTGLKSH